MIPTPGRGWGLFAKTPLDASQFVLEYVGEVLPAAEYMGERMARYKSQGRRHFYVMSLGGGEVIDAQYAGGNGRFINHSCDANCFTAKWTVRGESRVGVFTMRAVAAGEELSIDYNCEVGVETAAGDLVTCRCGARNCAGYLGRFYALTFICRTRPLCSATVSVRRGSEQSEGTLPQIAPQHGTGAAPTLHQSENVVSLLPRS